MSKEKQIEEMANTYYEAMLKARGTLGSMNEGAPKWYAKHFYEAGYRKQEWISVDERLPQSEQMVLCYTPCDGFMFVGFYREVEPNPYWKSYWNIITAMRSTKKVTKKVTHWMPLPESPKGGETDE